MQKMSPVRHRRSHEARDCRREMELVVACCRSPLQSVADGAVLQIIKSGVNWNLLLELINFHRVPLIVGRKLSFIGSAGVSESVLEQVRYSESRAAIANLEQTAELLRILKLLQGNGVEVIPFKGTVFGKQLYGDLSLRQSGDIDLIVSQQDVLTIKRILTSAGYVSPSRLSPAQEIAFMRSACVYELRNPDRDVDLELHWKDAKHPSLPFAADFVWTGCQKTSIGAIQIKTLSPETLLLLLCAHATKHCWRRLRHICDIADLIRVTEHIDWPRLLRNADQLGVRRMVLTGLSLAHGLLRAPVPDEVLKKIRKNPQVQRIAVECSAEIFHSSWQEPGYWTTCWFNLRSFDNWRGRLRYFVRMALRPGIPDFEAARLPRFLFPLYPFIRLLRLFGHLKPRAHSSTTSREAV